jgi:DNA mismatch repair protein MLH1
MVDAVYADYTKSKPFVTYLSIHVPPNEVDVNVHPSKTQVALLHQDEIYQHIIESIRKVLDQIGRAFVPSAATVVENPYKKKRKSDDVMQAGADISIAPAKKQNTSSKDKIRTNKAAPAGAIEPFLVTNKNASAISTRSARSESPSSKMIHEESCPLFKSVDLAEPGAFAKRCTCATLVRTPRKVPVKVPKIVTTKCTYKSIQALRNKMQKHNDEVWKEKLRKEAIFIGRLSQQRCLVQCGAELQEWHFERIAQTLFQQLALQQFGGMKVGKLGSAVNISEVVGQLLELEDLLDRPSQEAETTLPSVLTVRESHEDLASQVASCLLDRSEMLKEYFAIGVERSEDSGVILTSLPEILPGHYPRPSGLPLFLLRLATEVSWEEERLCFQGVSRELGLYYGAGCQEYEYLQHQIFPAVCQLLLPPKGEVDKFFCKLTQLSSLYKVFER